MLSIQTNANSLVAQENLRVSSSFQSQTIQRLTSGYRINSSGDDAAGLAVANKFRNSIAELTQGVANGNDAVAQLQIMDGGMNNIGKILDRLKTLAMQSASASFTGSRTTLNSEFQTQIAEIDRQAQSIGLNASGVFAKSLQIYLGAGSGSQSVSNSAVSVDLSRSLVDSQGLGLTGVQVVNNATYDLGATSTSSVQAVMNDATNAVGTTFQFKFFGAGFANNTGTSNDGVAIDVYKAGVGDVATLVEAINSAIQIKAQGTSGAGAAFKAANISASIVTDADGNQKLAFTSSVAGFEVQGADRASNALLGYFDATAGAPTGANQGRTLTTAAAADNSLTLNAGTVGASITISGDGITGSVVVTLGSLGATATLSSVVDHINSVLAAAEVTGVTAQLMDGGFQIGNVNGNSLTVTETASTGSATLGFGAATGANTGYGKLVANGSYELGNTTSQAVTNLGFHGTLIAEQDITVTANDANGSAHSKTIALQAGTTGSIDAAIGAINDALQKSNDATLKQITAVKVKTDGVDSINFVSTVSAFQVTVGSTSANAANSAALGLSNASGAQGVTLSSVQNGEGGSADISTMAGAQAAVTAITSAVTALGSAQASIGKGQNQLGYAITLAQSQITNFSSAQAQIRDADIAAEAANLTKAQVLQQASMAAMAQANSAPQAVLSLLRG